MPTPTTTGALALSVLQQNARAFQEHAPGARAGDDPRHIHQMRVAARRLRAALRLFGDLLPPQAGGLSDELKWIAGQLGQARDLDVQIQRLRASGATLRASDALEPYAAWLAEQRQHALAALTEALGSARFDELVERLNSFDVWTLVADPPLADDARARLRRVHKKLDRRARKAGKRAAPPELHAVRIAAKRLRYAAEFCAPLYGKPATRLIKRLTAVQDLLGDLQDGVVSGERIHEAVQTVAGAWPAETALALGRLLQYDEQRGEQIRRRFRRLYRGSVAAAWARFDSRVAMS